MTWQPPVWRDPPKNWTDKASRTLYTRQKFLRETNFNAYLNYLGRHDRIWKWIDGRVQRAYTSTGDTTK